MHRWRGPASLWKRYELEGELGRGASGTVYRARDRATGHIVAIKVQRREEEDRGAHRSTRCLEPMPHPTHENIVTTYEVGARREGAYVVMEWGRGGDLRQHAERENLLPLTVILAVIARVADALAHVHAHQILHGDVKPANILYDPASTAVKLTDFPYQLCAPTRVPLAGTTAYMSPERMCGMTVGPPSDQFSIGVTLYQLACGYLPFATSSLPRLAFSMVNDIHRDIRTRNPALPSALAAVLDRALEKRPEARYDNAQELAAAIRAVAKPARAPDAPRRLSAASHRFAVAATR